MYACQALKELQLPMSLQKFDTGVMVLQTASHSREEVLQNPHHPWIFEAELGNDPGCSYRLRVERGGITHEQHDPYAFRHEWMGAMDRHLFAEGNHHHIWKRMGAHPHQQDGITGVQFCLWAPSARSVSVIGECNNWDGRHLPMQQRIGGIWELFVPGLGVGAHYKYEIHTQEGHCYSWGMGTNGQLGTGDEVRQSREILGYFY